MEQAVLKSIYPILPNVIRLSKPNLSFDYDEEADVLYITFENIAASDSELTDDDILIRRKGKRIVGITIMHASRFLKRAKENS